MSTDMREGQVVAVLMHGTPVSITKIAKVKTRLGKVTGYTTTDKREWTKAGSAPGAWPSHHIVPATDEHGKVIRLARLTSRLTGVTREQWASLPLDLLRAVNAALDAAKPAGGR